MTENLTHAQLERIKKLGLNPADFKPSEEQTTIADVVEALDILTSIVLGDEYND